MIERGGDDFVSEQKNQGPWAKVRRLAESSPDRLMMGVLAVTFVFGMFTLDFYPTFAYPHGDEATYISYAREPWSNVSPFFEGFRPKEFQNPYNFRLFLAPMSVVTSVFGFTSVGTRFVHLLWGLCALWLGYRIGRRLGSPLLSAAAMAVMAWSPYFLYFTHAIRPEGMFTMWLLLTTWTMLRPERPGIRTWASVGFLSSCCLWIHYNGVVMPILFFLVMLFHDRGGLSWKKVLGFAGGGVAFLLLYVPLNILPALETIREYGMLPVTFSSGSVMPVTVTWSPWRLWMHFWQYYSGFFGIDAKEWWIDPGTTGPFIALLVPLVFWAVLEKRDRGLRSTGLLLLLLILAMMTVIPNRRMEYAYYLLPFLFILGGAGAARLPAAFRSGAAAAVFGVIAISFGASLVEDLGRFSAWSEENARCAAALEALVRERGGEETLVLGAQEFRVAVPEVRFRTFHSMIRHGDVAGGDFPGLVDRFSPDVVIQHDRMERLIASYMTAGRPPAMRFDDFKGRIARAAMQVLRNAGYVEANADLYRWDGQDVTFWVKAER